MIQKNNVKDDVKDHTTTPSGLITSKKALNN